MNCPKRVLLGICVLAIGCVVVALLLPLYHLTPPAEPPDVVNDVARLNRTLVREVIHPRNTGEIRDAVLAAAKNGLKVTIAGKRHSMGGQTLYPDAIALDMLEFNKTLSLDETNKILTVQSGATWSSIQEFLNPHGLAVLAMQGPNVFTVGGSMSVNAHGWDMRHGPVAASVEWFRILLADGSIRRCSREENSELFHFDLGGYIFRFLPGPCCARPLRLPTRGKGGMTDGRTCYRRRNTRFGTDIFSIYRADMAGVRGYVGLYRSGWNTLPRMSYGRETTFFVRQLTAFGITRQEIPTFCKSTSSRRRTSPHLSTACARLLRSAKSTY